jgi:hypothetical protein
MKKVFIILTASSMLLACGGGSSSKTEAAAGTEESAVASTETGANPEYDPKRGEGKFTAENVQVGATVDAAMATDGEKIQGVKCSSCHKLTDEKLVGPGWKDVTVRRTPEWLMNFITNPDPMIDKDPSVQASLELCLVRMPNQSLTDDEARHIVEFMRKNDGVKY